MKFICNKEIEGEIYKVFELSEEESEKRCENCDIGKYKFDCEENGGLPCLGILPLNESIGKNYILKKIIENPVKLTVVTSVQNIVISISDIELEEELAFKILKEFDYTCTNKSNKNISIYKKDLGNIKITVCVEKMYK